MSSAVYFENIIEAVEKIVDNVDGDFVIYSNPRKRKVDDLTYFKVYINIPILFIIIIKF